MIQQRGRKHCLLSQEHCGCPALHSLPLCRHQLSSEGVPLSKGGLATSPLPINLVSKQTADLENGTSLSYPLPPSSLHYHLSQTFISHCFLLHPGSCLTYAQHPTQRWPSWIVSPLLTHPRSRALHCLLLFPSSLGSSRWGGDTEESISPLSEKRDEDTCNRNPPDLSDCSAKDTD